MLLHILFLVLKLATTPVLAPGLSPPPKQAGKATTKNKRKKRRLKDTKSFPPQKGTLLQGLTPLTH